MAAASLAYGQAGEAELFGAVRDSSGLPVPDARVRAENQSTGARFGVLTDEKGEYHLLGLPAGDYALGVEQAGFRAYRREGIRQRMEQRAGIDVKLELGAQSQSVEVPGRGDAARDYRGLGRIQRGPRQDLHHAPRWPQFHPAGGALARRCAARRIHSAADQRQPPAHQRISLRRHQRPPTRARAGWRSIPSSTPSTSSA